MDIRKVIENRAVPVYMDGKGEILIGAVDMYCLLNPKKEFINWMDSKIKKLKREYGTLHVKEAYKNSEGRRVVEYYFYLHGAKKIVSKREKWEEKLLARYLEDITWEVKSN